ncbi:hypothetical protein RFI_06443 [Reticulomyxa filosa]|uniref:Uncharacterized protein n=1 Tax=Reticulomyxa filosa TaxID=46433 RepID=X6NXE2_RETFI|nr:hypothetical protein RFI_06443 [Reticulomyxa filosa]|eukprot:ETO30676.1 hypothetical protein RFI_06443 [Reticulomyxa filosa]
MKQGNTRVRVDLNNEKWENVDMQLGDEVKCSYLIDDSGQVVIQSINFPEILHNMICLVLIDYKIKGDILEIRKQISDGNIPKNGDTLKFRLQFVKNEWHPKKVKLVPHNPPFCVVVATFNK